ncbi:MAG TPA: hypothetical protein DCS91_15540 [Microcoleaceae bacterium UBA11344]|nr:hypothetical protein [Microcoleaceae cyanobacterium UBA11344]
MLFSSAHPEYIQTGCWIVSKGRVFPACTEVEDSNLVLLNKREVKSEATAMAVFFCRVRVERRRHLKQKLRHCKLLELKLFLWEIIRKVLPVMCWEIQVLSQLILLWEAVKLPGVTAIFQSLSKSRKLSKSDHK